MILFFTTVLVLLILLLCWILFAPFELRIDTRVPQASFSWFSIGTVLLVYDKDTWRLQLQVLFFKKEWTLRQLFTRSPKKHAQPKAVKKRSSKPVPWKKFFRLLKTFRVVQCQIVADTGSYPLNAQLYALNFYPPLQDHVVINFNDENYVVLITRNAPWRLLYAWIK